MRTVAAWATASFIRTAKAVGSADYALAAAHRIVEREAEWKDVDPAHRFDQCDTPAGCGPADNPLAFDYSLMGMGSLLWAFHDLPGFDAKIDEYRAHLLAQQDAAGSWDVGDSQITAYVVLGLAAVGGPGTSAAVTAAAGFFQANQLANGGWPAYVTNGAVGAEYTEVTSEVVRAIDSLFNTMAGASISVTPAQLATVTFTDVISPGRTTVVARDTSAAARVPGGFRVVGGLTYEMSTLLRRRASPKWRDSSPALPRWGRGSRRSRAGWTPRRRCRRSAPSSRPDMSSISSVLTGPGARALLDAVGAAGARAKIRTGGIRAEEIPAVEAVAEFLAACAGLRLAFKATAGLHHPVRGSYPLTYDEGSACGTMFGYLNLVLAATLLWEGGSMQQARVALAAEGRERLVATDDALAWGDVCCSSGAPSPAGTRVAAAASRGRREGIPRRATIS